jgi:hypothetical protein
MLHKPYEFGVNQPSATVRPGPPCPSLVNREAELMRRLESNLAAFDQELMTDPRGGMEVLVQSFSRATGYLAPIAVLAVLFGALSDSF